MHQPVLECHVVHLLSFSILGAARNQPCLLQVRMGATLLCFHTAVIMGESSSTAKQSVLFAMQVTFCKHVYPDPDAKLQIRVLSSLIRLNSNHAAANATALALLLARRHYALARKLLQLCLALKREPAALSTFSLAALLRACYDANSDNQILAQQAFKQGLNYFVSEHDPPGQQERLHEQQICLYEYVHRPDPHGVTAVMTALECAAPGCLELLLKLGADVRQMTRVTRGEGARTGEQMSPLMGLAQALHPAKPAGDAAMLVKLIEAGVFSGSNAFCFSTEQAQAYSTAYVLMFPLNYSWQRVCFILWHAACFLGSA